MSLAPIFPLACARTACETPAMPARWSQLLEIAREEVAATIRDLPDELRPLAKALPLSYEPAPSDELVEDGLDADLLGLFVGDGLDVPESERSPLPCQIFLFLENLWEFAEEDEEVFRTEVHVTYIHEFGHYLGLDEEELEERGLL
jgi:predicted Zn-dependent protease with MMP-like domain